MASSPKDVSIICPYCKRGRDGDLAVPRFRDLFLLPDPRASPASKPRANTVSLERIAGDGHLPITCNHCKKVFVTLIATVRAKRSYWVRGAFKRFYSVRIKHYDGTEELLEYGQDGPYDFELRGGDLAAFSYRRKWGETSDTLEVSQNLTLGLHQVNTKPFPWGTVLFVIAAAALGGFFAYWRGG